MTGSRLRIIVAGGILVASGLVIAAAMAVSNPNVKATLTGYQEVPAVSSDANGKFEAKVSGGDGPIRYELRYRRVQDVTQAHLHFAQTGVNGGIVVFICTNLGNGPEGTPECPEGRATLTGVARADDVVGGAEVQGIAAGELDEVKAAIRAGAVYANVHSEEFTGGEIRGQLRLKR
jgi:CHRD domain